MFELFVLFVKNYFPVISHGGREPREPKSEMNILLTNNMESL